MSVSSTCSKRIALTIALYHYLEGLLLSKDVNPNAYPFIAEFLRSRCYGRGSSDQLRFVVHGNSEHQHFVEVVPRICYLRPRSAQSP